MTLARRTREHALQVLTAELGARDLHALERRARAWLADAPARGVRVKVAAAWEALSRAGVAVGEARHAAHAIGRADLAADLERAWPWHEEKTADAPKGRPPSDLAIFASEVSPDDRIAALAWVAWGPWAPPARATSTPAHAIDAVRRAVKKTRAK
jgi:hypothetical protein